MNSQKFNVTVNFKRNKFKRLQKDQCYFVWYTKKLSVTLRRFPIISEDFLRLSNIPEDQQKIVCVIKHCYCYFEVVINKSNIKSTLRYFAFREKYLNLRTCVACLLLSLINKKVRLVRRVSRIELS